MEMVVTLLSSIVFPKPFDILGTFSRIISAMARAFIARITQFPPFMVSSSLSYTSLISAIIKPVFLIPKRPFCICSLYGKTVPISSKRETLSFTKPEITDE